jgi:hypothetical protein
MELWWAALRSRVLRYDGAGTAEVTSQPEAGGHAVARFRGRASAVAAIVIDRPVVLGVIVISTGLASSRRIGARAKARALGICASRLSAR